jgi:hypothetical protein
MLYVSLYFINSWTQIEGTCEQSVEEDIWTYERGSEWRLEKINND